MYRFGWFSTGRDEAARELVRAVHEGMARGEIEGEIAFVFCSREPGESAESDLFLRLVGGYRIPLVSFSYQKYRAGKPGGRTGELPQWRLDYDREVMSRLERFHPDIIVLAGYMLIVGPEMCSRYNMINLHPAAPGGPAGTWQEVIWQLMEQGVVQSGVMTHLVTPELDKGPVVSYCIFSIAGEPLDSYWRTIAGRDINQMKRERGENNHLFRLIREHGLKREFPLIIATMKAFSQGRVGIEDGRVVDSSGRPMPGYDLTSEIDELVGSKLDG
ncbi:MAG: phosphoglycerate transporter [Dehalococcoidales bacterium]|nr:phosphoglycerate transporter [Dehalococcoidales bacterium]